MDARPARTRPSVAALPAGRPPRRLLGRPRRDPRRRRARAAPSPPRRRRADRAPPTPDADAHRHGRAVPGHADRRRGHRRSRSTPSRERIVSLTPAATETLFALGRRRPRRRARSRTSRLFPPEAARRSPTSPSYGAVDVEQIVGLEHRPRDRRRQQLQPAGGDRPAPQPRACRSWSCSRRTSRPRSTDIELIGTATGRPDEAAAITDAHPDEFDEVGDAIAGLPDAAGLLRARRDRAAYFGPSPTTTSAPR